jgi:hypothetical protein
MNFIPYLHTIKPLNPIVEMLNYNPYYCWNVNYWGRCKENKIPIPDINVQNAIGNIYRVLETCKSINAQLKNMIKTRCPMIVWVVVSSINRKIDHSYYYANICEEELVACSIRSNLETIKKK